MDHEGSVRGVVGTGVDELEAPWKLEVDLHRGDLPSPADRVPEMDVDFGRIERALTLGDPVGDAGLLERF
jgi:hypothetical protein